MNAFVATTDRDWFDFLAERGDVDEVNFWQQSEGGGRFRALGRGEPFLFTPAIHASRCSQRAG